MRIALASVALGLVALLPAQVIEGKPPIASDWERVRTLPERARAKVSMLTLEPNWIEGSSDFWFVVRAPGKKSFLRVRTDRKDVAPAFDHAELASALAKQADNWVKAEDLPFNSITLGEGGMVEFSAFDKAWRWDGSSKTLKEGPPPVRDLPQGPRAGLSPDGKWRVSRTGDNLTLTNVQSGETNPLTEDGSPTGTYDHARWSPDSKRVVACRVVPGDRFDMVRIESVPRDGFRPKVVTQRYALPGDKVDQLELWVLDVEGGRRVRVESDPIEDFYSGPPQLSWSSDGSEFRYTQLYRGYQRRVVRAVDAATGRTRDLLDENTFTRLHPYLQVVEFVGDDEFLYASERDGWNHFYVYNAKTGGLVRQVTSGHWAVRSLVRLERDKKQIVFLANGREPGDPYHVHAYRVGLDGSGLTRLTPEGGNNTVTWSPDGRYLVTTTSTVQDPPRHELRSATTGELIVKLGEAKIASLENEGWRAPTPFVAKARDAATDLYGVIWFPSHFNPARKYPVVEYIYAGPHDAHVPKSFLASDRNRMLAELGVIVVQVDALGTGRRGKAFSDFSHKNLGDAGLDDRIGWMKAAAQKYPQMDLTRVGIYGYSAGGYDSTRALLAKPEFYKVAVSLCGNHDHRTDKVWWNELWMGYPIGPEYAEQSNIENASKLQGKLLLVAGELDDNVNPHAATLRLVDALVKADKDFDMLFLPGRTHNLGGWYVDRRIFRHFVEHLGVGSPR